MNQLMIAVYDAKAECYMQPAFVESRAVAVRAFSDCVNDPNHNFGMHPEDYSLFHIGNYKPRDGTIVAPELPEAIIHAMACVLPKEEADL